MTKTVLCLSLIAIITFASLSLAKIDPESIVGIWLLDEGKGDVAKDTVRRVSSE